MARLTFADLLRILEEHPRYAEIALGVEARKSLVIVFAQGGPTGPAADVLEAIDGKEIIISKTGAGRVTSIEIQ